MTGPLNKNIFYESLTTRLAACEGLEAKLDEIRDFKKEQIQPLKEKFLNQKIALLQLMETTTQLADAILVAAYEMAVAQLSLSLGTPQYRDESGNFFPGEFAIIGMGKLGGHELHFASDLDVICIYNQNGETIGPKTVTNREYFAKLTQRIISYLTLHTSHGYAYRVDTELRPSGMAGALVTPMESWISYYEEMGQIWERQALLRARLIYASGNFSTQFDGLFHQLIFSKTFPEDLGDEIYRLRMRIERELTKESKRRWYFKKGYGGLVDIEFLVQYLQLKLGKTKSDIISPNTLLALQSISKAHLLPAEKINILRSAYEFYRRLEFHLALQPDWNESYLNPKGEIAKILADQLGFKNQGDFVKKFAYDRESVRKIFLETFQVQDPSHDV